MVRRLKVKTHCYLGHWGHGPRTFLPGPRGCTYPPRPKAGHWGNWKLGRQQFAQRGPLSPAGRTRCERPPCAVTVAEVSGARGPGQSSPLALLLRGKLHKCARPPRRPRRPSCFGRRSEWERACGANLIWLSSGRQNSHSGPGERRPRPLPFGGPAWV